MPGDVILMGTPCHSRSVDPGDVVECEITSLSRVAGTVVAIDAPRASALGVGHQPADNVEVRRVALGFDERVPDEFKDGCVVHASAATIEPGLVEHRMGRGLIVGEPAGGRSERVQRIADLLAHAGFDVTHSERVRYDIWYKLWGNLTMNPVSAITGATGDRILADPLVREFGSAAMREAAAIGARIGCAIEQSPEDRHAITAKLGAFKTSMLQDVEGGRAIELDSIVGVVREIGARLAMPTPFIDALFGITRLFGRVRGVY